MRSNNPDELHEIQRMSFLPAIDLIKSQFDVQDLNSGTGLPQFSAATTVIILMSPLCNPTDYFPNAACLVKCLLPISDVGSQFSYPSNLIFVAERYKKVHQEPELLFGQQNSS